MTRPRGPDPELRLWRALTRRLPPIPKALGLANHVARRVYCRRHRPPVRVDVRGVPMDLDPHDMIDGLLLFAPHLVDRRERRFLRDHARPTDVFLDGGACRGTYAFDLAHFVDRVVAVEADAVAAAALVQARRDVTVVHAALSDRVGIGALAPPPPGNTGHRVLSDAGAPVRLVDLPTLATEVGADRFDLVKLDLEGEDRRVIRHALATWPRSRWPRVWVVECPRGDAAAVLAGAGYRVRRLSRLNVGAVHPRLGGA